MSCAARRRAPCRCGALLGPERVADRRRLGLDPAADAQAVRASGVRDGARGRRRPSRRGRHRGCRCWAIPPRSTSRHLAARHRLDRIILAGSRRDRGHARRPRAHARTGSGSRSTTCRIRSTSSARASRSTTSRASRSSASTRPCCSRSSRVREADDGRRRRRGPAGARGAADARHRRRRSSSTRAAPCSSAHERIGRGGRPLPHRRSSARWWSDAEAHDRAAARAEPGPALAAARSTTRASRASVGCCAARASTSCPSSGACSRAR